MSVRVNDKALDIEGLWRTAYRLANRSGACQSVERTFFKLLRARIEYLTEEGSIVLLNGGAV